MNGSRGDRYSTDWERLSLKLRKVYPCAICGCDDYSLKECHHIDGNKANGNKKNAVVLCRDCHRALHKEKIALPDNLPAYCKCGESVMVACSTTCGEGWFEPTAPLKIIPNLKPEIANAFRRRHGKGFIRPGSCNI